VNLDFRETVEQKLNTEISWTLRQISDSYCSPYTRFQNGVFLTTASSVKQCNLHTVMCTVVLIDKAPVKF